jgi:Holliday junction DNA helicase RuvB
MLMIETQTVESIDTEIFNSRIAAESRAAPERESPTDPFDCVVGQSAAVEFLRRIADGIRFGGEPDPMLLQGPSGRGKTLLASRFAASVSMPLVPIHCGREVTPAALIEKIAGHLDPAVVFLDEVHSLPKRTAETMYMAIDQAKVPALKSGAVDRIGPPTAIARHVWIAASNMPGEILRALRARFVTICLAAYSAAELIAIGRRKAEDLGIRLSADAIAFAANACGGSPRLLGHLLKALAVTTTGWRYEQDLGGGDDEIDLVMVEEIAALLGIDRHGLDATSRTVLDTIQRQPSGALSAETLAVTTGLDLGYVRERLAELRGRGLVSASPGRGWSVVSRVPRP